MDAAREIIRDLLPRLERFGKEVSAAGARGARRMEFETLCQRYTGLAEECGAALGRRFPERCVAEGDFGLVPGIVREEAFEDLRGLAEGLVVAAKRGLADTGGAMRCPKAGGRPCQMHGEINPKRFGVFFALPFKDPPSCMEVCNALSEWLERERGLEASRMFRADRWVSSGDFVCKICKAMQESEMVVADITKRNANVYFELGMAMGMNKPAILLRDAGDEEKDVGSDLLALEYVEYDGKAPGDEQWLRRFGVLFDGLRRGGE